MSGQYSLFGTEFFIDRICCFSESWLKANLSAAENTIISFDPDRLICNRLMNGTLTVSE